MADNWKIWTILQLSASHLPTIYQPSAIPYMSEIQSITRKLEDMVDFFIYLVF